MNWRRKFTQVLQSQNTTSQKYQTFSKVAHEIIDVQNNEIFVHAIIWSPKDDNLSHEFIQNYK